VEKYGRAGKVKEDTIIWRMRFVYWITKAIDTHADNAYLKLLHCKVVTRKLLNVKIICTLPSLYDC